MWIIFFCTLCHWYCYCLFSYFFAVSSIFFFFLSQSLIFALCASNFPLHITTAMRGRGKWGSKREWCVVWRVLVGAMNWGVQVLNHIIQVRDRWSLSIVSQLYHVEISIQMIPGDWVSPQTFCQSPGRTIIHSMYCRTHFLLLIMSLLAQRLLNE